ARTLIIAAQMTGSLDGLRPVKMGVYVQCSEDFTQISEVGDGASQLLVDVLGADLLPARTSVGVYRLPKDAAVEVDLELFIDAQTR
ncbi:MAG TPA: RidA family protein, partial [Burkholderiaceae bacterium]|nr:RidA family protein [Burkholderiaceae bacterium]